MEQIFLQLLTVSYASVGVLGKLGYWPTIKDLYYHKKPSANIKTYALWSLTTAVVCLYALFVLNDFWFRLVAVLDFLSCFTIFMLSANLKYGKNRKECRA